MTPVLVKNDIEQFRNILTCHLGLQFEDEKLDYLADVMLQRMQSMGRARFDSCSAYEHCGVIQVKDKGAMSTWFLNNRALS